MSGHSRWATIKHKKGAADARRGTLFTKLINGAVASKSAVSRTTAWFVVTDPPSALRSADPS